MKQIYDRSLDKAKVKITYSIDKAKVKITYSIDELEI